MDRNSHSPQPNVLAKERPEQEDPESEEKRERESEATVCGFSWAQTTLAH